MKDQYKLFLKYLSCTEGNLKNADNKKVNSKM